MRFSDLKIKTKIMTGALALVLITVIFGGLAYTYIGKVSSALLGITDRDAKAVEYATGVERMALNTIMEEKNYLISQSDKHINGLNKTSKSFIRISTKSMQLHAQITSTLF